MIKKKWDKMKQKPGQQVWCENTVLPLLLTQFTCIINITQQQISLSLAPYLWKSFNMHSTQKEESCGKQKRGKTELRNRGSRLALMVNDMLALWLGLARAPELLKYLHAVQNLFTSNQQEQRGKGSEHGQFSTSWLN